ncbi:hypothetical protein GJAV_G00086430 [Gymnothorax javanicus]|nr:hypothetical protein GJAV_G00086430 [Gymnothorax javanicus]
MSKRDVSLRNRENRNRGLVRPKFTPEKDLLSWHLICSFTFLSWISHYRGHVCDLKVEDYKEAIGKAVDLLRSRVQVSAGCVAQVED